MLFDENDDDEVLPGIMNIYGRVGELSRARSQEVIGSEDLTPSTGVIAPAIVYDTGFSIASEPSTVQPISRELRALLRDMAPVDVPLTSEP